MKSLFSLAKEKAPKWSTYFSPKERKVMYRIIFYASNKAHLAFASYERYQKDCECSHMTVLRTIKKACSLGILENVTQVSYTKDEKTGLIYFRKRLKLKWLGDVAQKKSEAFLSLNVSNSVNKNVSLYNKKRNSLKREEKRAPQTFNEKRKKDKEFSYPKEREKPVNFRKKNKLSSFIERNKLSFKEKNAFCLKEELLFNSQDIQESEKIIKTPKVKEVWEELKKRLESSQKRE